MTDSAASRESTIAVVARAERPPSETSSFRTLLITLGLLFAMVLIWEGLKAFSQANNYEITVAGVNIDLTIFNNSQLPHLLILPHRYLNLHSVMARRYGRC